MLTSLFMNTLLCLSLTRLIIMSTVELELKFFTKKMSINKACYEASKIQNEKANLNQLIKIILKSSSIIKTIFLYTVQCLVCIFLKTTFLQNISYGPFGLREREGKQSRVEQSRFSTKLTYFQPTLLYSPLLSFLPPSIQIGHQ